MIKISTKYLKDMFLHERAKCVAFDVQNVSYFEYQSPQITLGVRVNIIHKSIFHDDRIVTGFKLLYNYENYKFPNNAEHTQNFFRMFFIRLQESRNRLNISFVNSWKFKNSWISIHSWFEIREWAKSIKIVKLSILLSFVNSEKFVNLHPLGTFDRSGSDMGVEKVSIVINKLIGS